MQYNVCGSGAYFMYMWLVLSTFLAILAGYSVPMRADAPEKFNVPVTSAHMVKMVINHRSALDYARKLKWPYYCEGVLAGTTVTHCDKDKRIGFAKGRVTAENVAPYVPEGFSFNSDFLSDILCFNEDGTEADNCQNVIGAVKMKILFTYGDLHEKWLSSNSLVAGEGATGKPVVTPSEDMIKAFRQHFGYDEFVGYVVENGSNRNIINYQGRNIFTIPPAMWSVMDGSGICNKKYNGSCIAYVSVL